MKRIAVLLAAFGALLAPTLAAAEVDNVVSVTLPAQYRSGVAPAGMVGLKPQPPTEAKAAPTEGFARSAAGIPRQYTVVTPIFTRGDTISYMRFFNGQTTPITTNITVVGAQSGTILGTANVTVPVYAAPQYSIFQILQAANVPNPQLEPDNGVVLYLSDPQNLGNNGFQHVIYNINNGFFENSSMCTYLNNERYEGLNQILIGVHTSTLPLFPVTIYLHNYYEATVTYEVLVTDALDGTPIGKVRLTNIPGNTSYEIPFAFFEQVLGWKPRVNQERANMIFSATTPGYHAVVAQMVTNTRFGSFVNLTHFCAINHITPQQVIP